MVRSTRSPFEASGTIGISHICYDDQLIWLNAKLLGWNVATDGTASKAWLKSVRQEWFPRYDAKAFRKAAEGHAPRAVRMAYRRVRLHRAIAGQGFLAKPQGMSGLALERLQRARFDDGWTWLESDAIIAAYYKIVR